jgi:broad specificity polyphosphatase/5'/3'-nucleotidase SurE
MKTKRQAKLKAITKTPPKNIKSYDKTIKTTKKLIKKVVEEKKSNNIVLVNIPKDLAERYKKGDFVNYNLFKNFKFVISENSKTVHAVQHTIDDGKLINMETNSHIDICTYIKNGLNFYWTSKFNYDKDSLKQQGIESVDIYKTYCEYAWNDTSVIKSSARVAFDLTFKTETHAHRWLRLMTESYPDLRIVKEIKY